MNQKVREAIEKMNHREFAEAEKILESILYEGKGIEIEDDDATHYTLNNYIEMVLFANIFKTGKRNIRPEINYARIYYYLGYISNETKNYAKAIEYLKKGLKWNPIDVVLMFEMAAANRMIGNLEIFKAQIEKTYMYIYDSVHLAKYYRELGWYYSEKRIFDVANALYTHSISFCNTDVARKELMYIAQQENREPKLSTTEEIKELLSEYNIPTGFDKNIEQILFAEYKYLTEKKSNDPILKDVSMTLYDISLDKKFMLYNTVKNKKFGIEVKMPVIWKCVDKTQYSNENVVFLFLTSGKKEVRVECKGKCTKELLEEAYLKDIEHIKEEGGEIIREYSIEGKQHIKQVFVDIKESDRIIRVFKSYLVVNDLLFVVSWRVYRNIKVEDLYIRTENSINMDIVLSLNKIEEKNDKSEE